MRMLAKLGLLLLLALFARLPGAAAQEIAIEGSPAATHIVVGADGTTYVGVWITAPDTVPTRVVRAPIAVSLVIDVSGSMAGEKIANARTAAQSFVETLRDGDILSVYAFSDDVYEIAPPTVIGGAARSLIMQRLAGLRDLGSTNLYGGLATGLDRLRSAPPTHAIRRVVLLSDGHANVGPSDPVSIGNLASSGTEWRAQVTAIGLGLDYDEVTLGQLAIRSSGRLYHLASPSQMATILRDEFGTLAATVATDVTIEVVPAPGVILLDGMTMGARVEGGRVLLPVGAIAAGQSREVLFRARVDTSVVGTRPLGTARVVYHGAAGGAERVDTADLAYTVTPDVAAARASVSPRVEGLLASHRATEDSLAAAEALRAGDYAAADRSLAAAEAELARVEATAPAPVAERARTSLGRVRAARREAAAATAGGAGAPGAARGAALDAYDAAFEAAAH